MLTLLKHQLYAKYSKCNFGLLQIEYLGHLVSAEGVQRDTTKVEAILQWQEPKNIKQLRGFLGLVGITNNLFTNMPQLLLHLLID